VPEDVGLSEGVSDACVCGVGLAVPGTEPEPTVSWSVDEEGTVDNGVAEVEATLLRVVINASAGGAPNKLEAGRDTGKG